MNALFEEFSASNAATWKERLSKDLKGITFEDLSVTDRNGITIHPFYTSEDITESNEAIFTHKDWVICAAVKVENEITANKKALNELQNGASGLCFDINSDVDVAVLLKDIQLEYIYTQFNISSNPETFLSKFNQFIAAQNLPESALDYAINYDPIAQLLKDGSINIETAKSDFLKIFSATKSICIDASLYQNAGANSTYQIACCAAQINENLHWLDVSGNILSLKKITIVFSTGTDFFEEIAKLRALQLIISNLFEQYNTHPKVHLHIETSDTYRSAFDSYSNLLRDTISGMAAVLGGCNSLLIHSFDKSIHEAGEFNSRMSRNQQLIFKEESYLSQIADAATGSFYLEKLTEQFAEKAWELFQQIEKEDGLVDSFTKGIIKETVEKQAEQWIQEYKDGKRILIGVNKYVNAKDEPKPSTIKKDLGKGLKNISLTEELIN